MIASAHPQLSGLRPLILLIPSLYNLKEEE